MNCPNNVNINLQYLYILISGNQVIANGETSDAFYFYTLVTSPPSNVKCEPIDSESFQISWKPPQIKSGLLDFDTNVKDPDLEDQTVSGSEKEIKIEYVYDVMKLTSML